jgi:hypothetical protein
MRWAGHVARMGEKRNAYRLLVRKPARWALGALLCFAIWQAPRQDSTQRLRVSVERVQL